MLEEGYELNLLGKFTLLEHLSWHKDNSAFRGKKLPVLLVYSSVSLVVEVV